MLKGDSHPFSLVMFITGFILRLCDRIVEKKKAQFPRILRGEEGEKKKSKERERERIDDSPNRSLMIYSLS